MNEKRYAQRAELCQNFTAKMLLGIMESKCTNLAVSADVTSKKKLLALAEILGPQICVFKTHIDMIEDFDEGLITDLQALAEKHSFLIFEDRKFADIGNTVQSQYGKGIYKISQWAHITNAHPLPGPGIIQGLKAEGLPRGRGLLLLAEMSSAGNLCTPAYQDATLKMAEAHADFVIGLVSQRKISGNPEFIHFTPGVHLSKEGDSLGQQYHSPESAIGVQGSDVIIVGRGILQDSEPLSAACRYRNAGWNAYLKRLQIGILFICLFFAHAFGYAKSDDSPPKKEESTSKKEESPPKIGNFSLPSSQQPTPLLSFGEKVLDKGQVQLYFYADEFKGNANYKTDMLATLIYGITDQLSILLNLPAAPRNKDHKDHSYGWQDIFPQLEYAFYVRKDSWHTDQATVVLNMTFPTGSTHKIPPTGFGSPSFFLGTTFNRTTIDWVFFASAGGLFTTSYHSTKFGNQCLYECGIARCLWTPPGWIFAGLLEFDGQYTCKHRIRGAIDPNTGGNLIFITPSIWISSKNLILQLGAGPIFAHLNGKQSKQHYSIDFNLGWTF